MFKRLRIKISDYRFEKRMARQRYKKGFSDNDCWGMCYWLTETFPKMIINLRNMKHGAPDLPFEEYDNLPINWKMEELKKYKKFCYKNDYEFEKDSIFTKWYILLTRIAYCLEQASECTELPNEYKEAYNIALWGEEPKDKKFNFKEWWDKHFDKVEGGYILKHKEVDPELQENYYKVEKQNEEYKERMKDEALDLVKKYFYHLWD